MKILFVIHYCSPEINDNSFGPIYLASDGHDVLVISAQHAKSLKGDVYAPEYEQYKECKFYRPYEEWTDITRKPFIKWDQVKVSLDEFNPDVVVGFGEFNYKISKAISEHYKIPYFLFLEYLRLEKIAFPLRGRTFLKSYFPVVHDLFSKIFLRYLSKHVAAIMFSYFGDKDQVPLLKKMGVDAYYVPWCTDVGENHAEIDREEGLGLYIGALEKFKNSDELVAAIPYILDKTDTKKFIVVGPGPYSEDIKKLQAQYTGRLEYIESMPRNEALKLIRKATYGFTPVSDCGLGFIGDCWGCGTPIVATHELDGFLNADVDALIAINVNEVPDLINSVLSSPKVWSDLHNEGIKRYSSNYTAKAVGDMYLDVIKKHM